jgi:hypothetical protein
MATNQRLHVKVCIRYGSLYSCVTALSNEAEEAMLFSR